jgi:hypothetical protein
MIETLYLNGCSWTEGHLLHEEPHIMEYGRSIGYDFFNVWCAKKDGEIIGFPYRDIFDKFNFAATIAKELNIPKIHNDAIGGVGNSRIVRTTVDYVKNLSDEEKSKTLVVIGWTLPNRDELFLEDNEDNSAWTRFNVAHRFSEYGNYGLSEEYVKKVDKFWEHYVVDIYSYYYTIKKFFEQSYLLANLLENNNIKYYFFNAFPLFSGHEKYGMHENQVLKFQTDINSYYRHKSLTLDTNFYDYIKDLENVHLSDGHPNSLGHKLWADYIVRQLKNNIV